MSFWKNVKTDVIRQEGYWKFRSLIRLIIWKRTFRPIFTMRLCQSFNRGSILKRKILGSMARIFHHFATARAAIDLPWRTKIGPGFRIDHGWGLVVSEGATIGANCTVFHGVTIGRKDMITQNNKRVASYPIIEDEVWIGPHAMVIGRVRIARGSRIAPGTVVTSDVASQTIVGGNPMRVLREGAESDVSKPAPLE
jgi:serine O-acetyltransferase